MGWGVEVRSGGVGANMDRQLYPCLSRSHTRWRFVRNSSVAQRQIEWGMGERHCEMREHIHYATLSPTHGHTLRGWGWRGGILHRDVHPTPLPHAAIRVGTYRDGAEL